MSKPDLAALVAIFAAPKDLAELLAWENDPALLSSQETRRMLALPGLEAALRTAPPDALIHGHVSGNRTSPITLIVSHLRWEHSNRVLAAMGDLIGRLGDQDDINQVFAYTNPGTPYELVWESLVPAFRRANRSGLSLPHRRFPLAA